MRTLPSSPSHGPLSLPTGKAPSAQAWQTAKTFEANALAAFLKPMFDTVDTRKSLFSGGGAEDAWKPMLIDEIANQIAAAGGVGLAAPVHDAIIRMQEGKK